MSDILNDTIGSNTGPTDPWSITYNFRQVIYKHTSFITNLSADTFGPIHIHRTVVNAAYIYIYSNVLQSVYI